MSSPGHAAATELEELRRRVAVLEDRWPSDAEIGKVGTALTDGSNDNDYSTSGRYLASMAHYMSQGNAYRIANPSPFGLYAFGYTTALFQGPKTGWTEGGTEDLVYCYGLFLGGLIQFLAGMWEVKRNNLFGGTAFTCFGGFWLGYALNGILVKGGILEEPSNYARGIQMYLIIWGILAFIFFIATLAINISLQILLFSLTVNLFLQAIGVSTHTSVIKAAGYIGVWTAAVSW